MTFKLGIITALFISVSSENATKSEPSTLPPPAESMSRLLPSSSTKPANTTKVQSASNIDIITTPESSLGLAGYSSFPQTKSQFSPSPFLGVISESYKNYPRGVAVGQVFADTIGDHGAGHKYQYSISGQRTRHSGVSYHDQQQMSQMLDHSGLTPPEYRPEQHPTASTNQIEFEVKSTHQPEYTFEIPTGLPQHEFHENALHEYHLFPTKPIREEHPEPVPEVKPFAPHFETRPLHLPERPLSLTPFGHGHLAHRHRDDGKWKFVKLLATLVPLGLLVAAFTPSILVVNSTDTGAADPTQGTYRSFAPDPFPPGVELSPCQKRKICDSMTGVVSTHRSLVDSLVKKSGKQLQELADLAVLKKCDTIPCTT